MQKFHKMNMRIVMRVLSRLGACHTQGMSQTKGKFSYIRKICIICKICTILQNMLNMYCFTRRLLQSIRCAQKYMQIRLQYAEYWQVSIRLYSAYFSYIYTPTLLVLCFKFALRQIHVARKKRFGNQFRPVGPVARRRQPTLGRQDICLARPQWEPESELETRSSIKPEFKSCHWRFQTQPVGEKQLFLWRRPIDGSEPMQNDQAYFSVISF